MKKTKSLNFYLFPVLLNEWKQIHSVNPLKQNCNFRLVLGNGWSQKQQSFLYEASHNHFKHTQESFPNTKCYESPFL